MEKVTAVGRPSPTRIVAFLILPPYQEGDR